MSSLFQISPTSCTITPTFLCLPLETLKLHYDEILKSPSEPLFYSNVYKYIDLIVKTPDLVEVINKSAQEYETKHREIREFPSLTNRENDEKEKQVLQLEKFSIYAADYAFLHTRIYSYIEESKHHLEPGERTAPQAIAMLRGIYGLDPKVWNKETIDQCNKWYINRRKDYEERLRKFHLHFLTELSKHEGDETISPQSKLSLTLRPRTGDFTFHQTNGNFSPVTPEFKVLSALYNDKDNQASYLALIQAYRPDITIDSKSQKDDLYLIIKKIKEKLNIFPATETSNKNIFQNIKNYGYRLVAQAEEGDTE